MNKNKKALLFALSALSTPLVVAAPCTFDVNKTCTLATDLLKDKASNGLPYYAPTNYDHRMSTEINVYDASKVVKNTDGTLTLLANLINNGYWKSGEIMTRSNLTSPPYNAPYASQVWNTQATTHGYLEVNVKLPTCTTSLDNLCQQGKNPSNYNRGLWPAIWLLPFKDNTWPLNGEIDIMEAYPKNTAFNITTSALHFNGNAPACGNNDCKGWGYPLERHQFPELAYNKAHTWGFEWEKDPKSTKGGYIMTGYIDNVKTWGPLASDSLPADGSNAIARGFNDANGGNYLIINLAVGGNYADAPNPQMQSASMNVNSVKFYKVDNSAGGSCNPPTDLYAFYSDNKQSVNLNWTSPTDKTNLTSFQIKDWQKKQLWTGNATTWTQNTLPKKAGTFTYYISSVCGSTASEDVRIDVVIPQTGVCGSPTNITSSVSADKKSIVLNWNPPQSSLYPSNYQVKDWQNKLLYQGNTFSWTDKTLPGKAGTYTYYINTVCNDLSSTAVKYDAIIK